LSHHFEELAMSDQVILYMSPMSRGRIAHWMLEELGFGMMMKGLEPRPVFHAYVERIQARPAAKRTNEQSGELIARLKAAS
jgi:hypothetical protein